MNCINLNHSTSAGIKSGVAVVVLQVDTHHLTIHVQSVFINLKIKWVKGQEHPETPFFL